MATTFLEANRTAKTVSTQNDFKLQDQGHPVFSELSPQQEIPLPDVWIPFNDNLGMITGYGDEIAVGPWSVYRQATFSRASQATYIDKSGVLRTAGVDEPRFEKEGLLIEGASTNMCRWNNIRRPTGVGTVTEITSDKYQGITAIKVQGGTSTIAIGASREIVTPTTAYTGTMILDLANSNLPTSWIRLQFAYSTNWNAKYVNVNVNTLEVRPTTGTTGTAKRYGDLLSITATTTSNDTVDAAGGSLDCYYLDDTRTAVVPAPENYVCIVGFQLEALPFATSYIPTSGAAATRAADVASIPAGNHQYMSADQKTTYSIEFDSFGIPPTNGHSIIFCSRRSYSLCRLNTHTSGTKQFLTFYRSAGSSLPATPFNVEPNTQYRAAIRIDNNYVTGSMGDAWYTTTNQHVPANGYGDALQVAFGNYYGQTTTSNQLHGHIRNFRIWHKALPDYHLKALTKV